MTVHDNGQIDSGSWDPIPEDKVDFSTLSKREIEVLTLLCKGLSRAAVAKHLFRSPKTIDNHCTRIYHKLGVQSQVQLVSVVYRQGLITPQVCAPDQQEHGLAQRSAGARMYGALVPLENKLAETSPERFFGELVAGLAEAVDMDMAGITEANEDTGQAVSAFSVDRGVHGDLAASPLESTACGRTFRLGECACERNATVVFPDSEMIRVGEIESYVSVRLDARVLGTVGCLWVANREPIEDLAFVLDVLRLLRRRVSTEMALRAVTNEGRQVL